MNTAEMKLITDGEIQNYLFDISTGEKPDRDNTRTFCRVKEVLEAQLAHDQAIHERIVREIFKGIEDMEAFDEYWAENYYQSYEQFKQQYLGGQE